MAVRGWGGSIATAIGVAAGVGAAQLGLGYGLGIIAWLPSADGTREAVWVASLAWSTWIAATSVVAGAIVADRLSAEPTTADGPASPLATALWRLALAVAAAVGALVTVALVAVPARAAERADTFSPQTIAAGYAVIGVLVGLLVSIGALSSRAVATNVIATVGWLWLLAVVAVIDGVVDGRGLATAQLGVWQFTDNSEGYWFRNLYLPGVALSLGSALIIGALAGLPAARRGDGRVGIAVSGAVGPLLVAAAYFLAAPRLVGVRAEQLSAYLVAPYAVIAGLAGSVLITAVRARAAGPGSGGEVDRGGTRDEAAIDDAERGRDPAGAGWSAPGGEAGAGWSAPGGEGGEVATDRLPTQRAGDTGAGGLADDGYAPARAYASDTVTAPPANEPAGARGQAAVPKPLWPDDAKAAGGRPRPGRRGRGSGQT
jgi:hypothetical protein